MSIDRTIRKVFSIALALSHYTVPVRCFSVVLRRRTSTTPRSINLIMNGNGLGSEDATRDSNPTFYTNEVRKYSYPTMPDVFANHSMPRLGAADLAPPAIASLEVGGPSLALPHGRGVATRVASRPHAFLLRGFLSNAECESLMRSATAAGMRSAQTVGGTIHRSRLDFAWLGSDSPHVDQLTSDVSTLLLADGVARRSKASSGDGSSGGGSSGSGISSEPLNVLRYAPGGEFSCHYDNPIQMGLEPGARVLTVLYYLNGVGATWFPLARTQPAAAAPPAGGGADDDQPPLLGPKDTGKLDELLQRRSPLDTARVTVCSDGQLQRSSQSDGLKVAGDAGDALAFFHLDESGDFDLHAMHSGLPAPRTRWVASHFFVC